MRSSELVVRKPSSFSVRQEAARATLRDVRLRGHVYVELREVGKRTIFFCTLCLTPCYSDCSLFDHLHGNLHARRLAAAKATLFGPVPWPFNDGALFFSTTHEPEQHSSVSSSRKDVFFCPNGNDHEVTSKSKDSDLLHSVPTDDNAGVGMVLDCNGYHSSKKDTGVISCTLDFGSCENENNQGDCWSPTVNGQSMPGKRDITCLGMNGCGGNLKLDNQDQCLGIPLVLPGEETSFLRLHFAGYGHVASRICRFDEVTNKVLRIWCAWLGRGDSDDSNMLLMMSKCDFGVVIFSYTYDLGRPSGWDDVNSSLSCGSHLEVEDVGSPRKTIRMSLSDPEDSSEILRGRCGSSDECNGSPKYGNGKTTSFCVEKLEILDSISSRNFRRELRRQKRIAAERLCDICGQPMLVGKDVATLLNRKTGNLACSSRNTNGAFHVFHTSCLVHWILLCEYEMWNPKIPNKKAHRGRKGKKVLEAHMSSVLCPECQGTGMVTEENQLEKPTIPLSEMFLYKLKAIESHKAWMKNPEILHNCSTGLYFSRDSEENLQEQILPMKLLHFYRVDY
uniref:DNA ligase n=1 Tax=Anthurium amnicola TaxID=1678845 RepID=A0A1D1YTV1_9ARAE